MIHRNGIYTEFRDAAGAPEESRQLEAEGYAVAQALYTADEVDAMRKDISRIFDEYDAEGRGDRSDEEDQQFRYQMLNRSAVCQAAIAKPTLLAIVEPLLGEDCHVIANTAWRNSPEVTWQHGGGGWHIDAGPHIPLADGMTWPEDIPHPVFAIGVHIYLQDCRLEDGPTGVLPGSHLSGRFPPREDYMNDDLTWNGQDVVPLVARAGDVAFFVSDIWHRRMKTLPGDQGRFFLQVHFGRRDIAQRLRTTAEVNHLSEEAIARAQTDREKLLVGLHRPLFYDG